ncbi:MAG: 1-aminocyclopropane-1-carboxylate deaminase [Flavobacteriales bacterium]|nr:1-aminocyclopropane-1-carboxylate deaminase [Flavobacteriales bacterium]
MNYFCFMFPTLPKIPIQEIINDFLLANKVQLYVQREDLIHPEISGNKWRKLKYNVNDYYLKNCESIATFGGAYSNHISAISAVGKLLNIPTYGIIRGEEVNNSTLTKAKENGMILHFVSREAYKEKHKSEEAVSLISTLKRPYLIPEGGSNLLGLKGCQEIIQSFDFDTVVCACGTGSTISGVISSLRENQTAIGFSVLKGGDFLKNEIKSNLKLLHCRNNNWDLNTDFHFGGYAKYKPELVKFISDFWRLNSIKLDPVYTGKAMYGVFKLIESGAFKNKKVLFIHTGGLQGVKGFEDRYGELLFGN